MSYEYVEKVDDKSIENNEKPAFEKPGDALTYTERSGSILNYLDESIRCIEDLKKKTDQIQRIMQILENARENGKKLFLMGNGGSGSLASHLICDFSKFRKLKAIALTDSIASITAYSNDDNYDVIFKEQLKILAEEDDVVIGISGSGNSKNVIEGMEFAKQIGCHTIGLAGFDGGKLKDVSEECIIVEIKNMQHSEDMHTLLGHMVAFLMKEA
ncbi:MAG: SIS domain-containing protein [Thermoplasmatales archaeon]|nr:MAG: SIS domain-containing protein [Thermoplasmatales archaeon]